MSETTTSYMYTECVCAHVLSFFWHALVRDIQLCWGTFQHTQASSLFNNFVSPTSSVSKKSSPTNTRNASQTTESPSTRRNTINVRCVLHVSYVDVSRSVCKYNFCMYCINVDPTLCSGLYLDHAQTHLRGLACELVPQLHQKHAGQFQKSRRIKLPPPKQPPPE